MGVVSSHDGVGLVTFGFRGFSRVFAGFRLGFSPPHGLLSVLKHARTNVCCTSAEHTKMLVFTLKGKSEESSKEGKGVKDSSINDESKGSKGGKSISEASLIMES